MKKAIAKSAVALATFVLLSGCQATTSTGVVFPNASTSYENLPLETLQAEFEGMGFTNVKTSETANKLGMSHDGEVIGFDIDGSSEFDEGAEFSPDAALTIECYGPYVTPVTISQSSDIHKQYIKNYRGMNAASFGYTSLGGDRRDYYGNATIKLVFVTPDGEVADFTDEEVLKDYIVYDQNIEPNTEMNIAFETDDDGEEYEHLEAWTGFDEIVLDIKKIGEEDGEPIAMTPISQGDKYNRYVGDFVGRNLGNFGYTSWGGDRRFYVGGGNIKLNIITEDGSFVDPEDYDSLNNYVVTSQSVAPNTPVTVTFGTDGNGKEYDNLGRASIDAIDVNVKRVG